MGVLKAVYNFYRNDFRKEEYEENKGSTWKGAFDMWFREADGIRYIFLSSILVLPVIIVAVPSIQYKCWNFKRKFPEELI